MDLYFIEHHGEDLPVSYADHTTELLIKSGPCHLIDLLS